MEICIQRHGDKCRGSSQGRGLAVVLVLEQLRSIREVMEQLLDQLLLAIGNRTVAGQHLHALTGSDVLHVPAGFG